VNCRALLPAEAAAYAALRREMLAASPWSFVSGPDDDPRVHEGGAREMLEKPEHRVIGAFDEAGLVAVAGVLREPRAKRRHLALVWGVYVTARARGRGVGRAVVSGAVETARSWGVDAVWLSVSENAPGARRLYESLGFVAWGVEPDALRTGGKSYAEVHMRLVLRGE
jgi:GNAT superfamily N-acetyltransferase